ncbi:TIGR00268 family protein, partial [Candidatus Altiarchaeota archaeon]
KDIRKLAGKIGLPNWDKPSMACLSSRIPYGERIDEEKLEEVEAAEKLLHTLGIAQCRVRHHGSIARIEVEDKDIKTVLDNRLKLEKALRKLGFVYVTLDLKGFRSGSMNEEEKE